MIRVIDYQTGRDFDLPAGIKISIEQVNPFLNETQGSISLPVNLPYTDNNLELLDNPQRTDRRSKLNVKRKVIIHAGIYQRNAVMTITRVQKNKPIVGTFLLDESVFYNQSREVTLQTVFDGYERTDFSGTHEEKVAQWADYLDRVMTDDTLDGELAVFPVCIKFEKTEYTMPTVEILGPGIYDFLNHPSVPSTNYSTTTGTYMVDGVSHDYYRLTNRNAISANINGTDVEIPTGYSISPFLKFSFVLEEIFSFFGFNLTTSKFHTDNDLKKLVLLNNTIDSLRPGKLIYSQLVPTCTVDEYLTAVRNDFGCEFIFDENGKDVHIVFWEDILTSEITECIDRFIQDEQINDFESKKSVKLGREYGSLLFEPKFKTYQLFNKSFNPITEIRNITTPVPGIYFDRLLLMYYSIVEYVDSTGYEYFGGEYLGPNSFDFYDSSTDYELMDKSSKSSFVQMIRADIANRWATSTDYYKHQFVHIPYIDTYRQLNTAIVYTDKTEKSDETKCPIMFCFRKGANLPRPEGEEASIFDTGNEKLFWGSTYRFNNLGYPDGNLNLVLGGENGLYETFWKKFDDVLKNSFQPVTVPLNITSYQILNFDMTKIKLLNGQPLIPESIKYEITDSGVKVIEAKFRTAKLYQ